jgi:outer membrane receptor protein involved in Fe transport
MGYAGQYVFEAFDGVLVTQGGNLVVVSSDSLRNDFVLTDDGKFVLSPTAAAPTAGLTQSNRIRMFTAETRLAKRGPNGTGWLIGVSLLHNTAKVRRRLGQSLFELPLTGVMNRVEEATLYGEGTIEPIDRLTVTLGGRLTRSRLVGRSEDVDDKAVAPGDADNSPVRSEMRVLPSAAVAYRPTDRLTLFARYQQGFRPGGIAARRDFVDRFKGDRVSTFEAGLRYSGGTTDLALNTALTNWSNIQADLIDGFGFPTTANVGDGRVLSAGVTARWRPIKGLELDAAVYVNKTKVTARSDGLSPVPGSGFDPETTLADFNRLPNIADVTGRFGVNYVTSLSDTIDLEANGYARYVGTSTLGVGPILSQKQGDYLDTGIEVRLGNRRRGVSLSATNLLDSLGNRFALGSPLLIRDRNQITPLQPRTVRLGFDMSF